MSSSHFDMMYSDAVLGLMNGCLMPWDKQVLSAAPIPSAVIEPYMEKEIPDVRESMRLTYETMVVWIDEAKKVNYFSKRFVQLSKMIMNGVTTMGRGLITLHARGEEPAGVPMSIQDLIGVASYHFRKSHLGVLQTVRSHPEISERLLMNQISWNNMLMRLFKTKEKLAKPVLNEEVRMKNEELPENKKSEIRNNISASGEEIRLLPANEENSRKTESDPRRGEAPALHTDRAKPVPHSAGMNEANCSISLKEKESIPNKELPGGDFDAFKVFGPEDRGFSEPNALREPGAFSTPRALRSLEGNKKSETAGNKKSEIRNKRNEEVRSKNEETESGVSSNEEGKTADNEEGRMKNEEAPDGNSDPSSFLLHNSSLDEDSSFDDSAPQYLKILQNVYARSGPTDDGKLNFTFDEVCYLAADPDFDRIYPGAAEHMRSLLDRLDTG